jgi:hypothetical protein
MTILFYPQEGELNAASLQQKLEILMEAAERYKAVVLDTTQQVVLVEMENGVRRRQTPRDIQHAYNWGELAKLLREVRELPEGSASSKTSKAENLGKLAAVYEVLRGAKMPKLEAVRLALENEASQLRT